MTKDDLHSKRRTLLVAELNDLQAYQVVFESRLDSEDSSRWKTALDSLFGKGAWVLVGKPTSDPRSLYVVAKQSLCLSVPRIAAVRLLTRVPEVT